jgi:hypothetical protein
MVCATGSAGADDQGTALIRGDNAASCRTEAPELRRAYLWYKAKNRGLRQLSLWLSVDAGPSQPEST